MSEKIEIWGVKDQNISAQLALAAELDLFKRKAGLDVSCKFLQSGTTMPGDVLAAEKKPYAFTQTPITSIVLHDKGFRTKLVAPLADIAGTQQIVIHEDSGIEAPQDLEGKKIGMAKGAAVLIALKNMAKDCHVDLDRVTFENLLPQPQLEAFKAGEIDAIACWEPWTTKAQEIGGELYFSGSRSEIPGLEGDVNWLVNQSCLIVPDDHLARDPDLAIAILDVLKEATHLINHDRKEISKVLANFFGLSRVELLTAMQKNDYSMRLDTLFRIGVLAFRDFLYENQKISTRFEESILYDTRYLAHVDPSYIKLRTTDSKGLNIVEREGVYYADGVKLNYDGSQMKFLMADDSRFVRLALSQAVKIIGGEVVAEATTGREAIDFFEKLRPNFVTMDLSMPDVSGVDAITSILQEDPNTNIIVISGTNLDEVREEVFNLGVKMFITKPFDPMRVATIIGELVG